MRAPVCSVGHEAAATDARLQHRFEIFSDPHTSLYVHVDRAHNQIRHDLLQQSGNDWMLGGLGWLGAGGARLGCRG